MVRQIQFEGYYIPPKSMPTPKPVKAERTWCPAQEDWLDLLKEKPNLNPDFLL